MGGAVRDLFLGKAVTDLDLAVPSGAVALARWLADELGGAFVLLDEARGCARVVRKRPGSALVVDVSDFRAPTLEGDLAARDLTINALAVPLGGPFIAVDPLGGLDDLRRGLVRLTGATALDDDPLRALRVARFAVETGFAIVPETVTLVRKRPLVAGEVSEERIRVELFKGLAGDPLRMAELLDELGLVAAVLPELDGRLAQASIPLRRAWPTLCELLRPEPQLPAELVSYSEELRGRLAEAAASLADAVAVLALACAYSPLGDAERAATAVQQRLAALRCSRSEQLLADASLRGRARLLRLVGPEPLSRRQLHLFHRRLGRWGVEAAFLAAALADEGDPHGAATTRRRAGEAIAAALRHRDTVVAPPPLLDGDALCARFGIPPGPRLGEVLAWLAEEQAAGSVQSLDDAVRFVERALSR